MSETTKKVFGTLGFSLFLGTLVGLSSAPVVGIILAALAGLIGLVVGAGRNARVEAIGEITSIEFPLLGIFGIFALAGVLLGLYVRTENPWGASIVEQKAEWIAAGYEETQANSLVIFQEIGLTPPGWTPSQETGNPGIDKPVLFAGSAGATDKLNPENFANAVDIRSAWSDEGEPWSRYAAMITAKIRPTDQKNAYEVVWQLASDE